MSRRAACSPSHGSPPRTVTKASSGPSISSYLHSLLPLPPYIWRAALRLSPPSPPARTVTGASLSPLPWFGTLLYCLLYVCVSSLEALAYTCMCLHACTVCSFSSILLSSADMYVSAYCYICVLIPHTCVYMCPHSVLILDDTTLFCCFLYICVRMLLCVCIACCY